jgi:hypothetical protein
MVLLMKLGDLSHDIRSVRERYDVHQVQDFDHMELVAIVLKDQRD